MLRLISAVTPPVQDKVHRYLATCMVTTANHPHPPPQGNISPGFFSCSNCPHLNHIWMHMRRDLQALHREHVVIVSLSRKVTVWRCEVTTAWMRPVRLARVLRHSSFMEATLHQKERTAAELLAFHSFTLSYTLKYSFIHVLWGLYRRQVSTIGGATLHMAWMANQKCVAWATMCMHHMRGHEQWLRATLTSVEDLYNVSFRRAACDTRAMWHNVLLSLTRSLWEEAASSRRIYFSECCSAHTARHLDQRWIH